MENQISILVINDSINKELRDSLDSRIIFYCLHRKIGSKNPVDIIRLNLLLFRLNLDVIHLHYSSIYRYIFFSYLKKKIHVTQHDICNKQNSIYLYKIKNIYAISNVVKDNIKRYTNLESEVVLNGIRPELIKHVKKKKNDTFRIVQISRLMYLKKGQDILIKAINILKQKGYVNFHVDFIGDGEDYQYLNDLTKELKLESFISFLGAKGQNYIFNHLCDYDLLIQPSVFEGFGLTVAEAMAAKIPVLVSKNQGPLEIIDNGRYGYYFENGDVDDCARLIELFLLNLNDKSQIENAYNRVLSLYNVKVTAQTYIQKYRK